MHNDSRIAAAAGGAEIEKLEKNSRDDELKNLSERRKWGISQQVVPVRRRRGQQHDSAQIYCSHICIHTKQTLIRSLQEKKTPIDQSGLVLCIMLLVICRWNKVKCHPKFRFLCVWSKYLGHGHRCSEDKVFRLPEVTRSFPDQVENNAAANILNDVFGPINSPYVL